VFLIKKSNIEEEKEEIESPILSTTVRLAFETRLCVLTRFDVVQQPEVRNISRRMMSERDYAPLSAACVRSLNDKLYEKRKPAAVEIEK